MSSHMSPVWSLNSFITSLMSLVFVQPLSVFLNTLAVTSHLLKIKRIELKYRGLSILSYFIFVLIVIVVGVVVNLVVLFISNFTTMLCESLFIYCQSVIRPSIHPFISHSILSHSQLAHFNHLLMQVIIYLFAELVQVTEITSAG